MNIITCPGQTTFVDQNHPFGLPHPPDRPGQLDTIRRLETVPSGASVLIHAPTGSGKTSFAAAMGHEHCATALVKTKSLQHANYEQGYGFATIYGRANYTCAKDRRLTAEDCPHADNKLRCPCANACDYLADKWRAVEARRRSMNYAYWLSSQWPRCEYEGKKLDATGASVKLTGPAPDYVFLDEAHQLSEITLEWVSVQVSMRDRLAYDLPPFPYVAGGVVTRVDIETVLRWLGECKGALERVLEALKDEPSGDKLADERRTRQIKRAESLRWKLGHVQEAMAGNSHDWYVRSGPTALNFADHRAPGFVARPLTARFDFARLFTSPAWRTVLMSATVGDPATFAEELGLAEYEYWPLANQFAPAQRPVRVLDAPPMGNATRNDEAVMVQQARVIAEAIAACPGAWSGLIHTSSKAQAKALHARLAGLGLGARLWLPDSFNGATQSTDAMYDAWARHRRRTPGALAVTWAWWEGFDGREEKISIVAKVPFPNLGDEYELARMRYSGAMYLQRTAWQLEQALGRTRRGRDEDYDTPEERRGLVAVADGNWTRVQKYLSADVREAMVKW